MHDEIPKPNPMDILMLIKTWDLSDDLIGHKREIKRKPMHKGVEIDNNKRNII